MKELTQRLIVSALILSFILTAISLSDDPFFKPIFILLGSLIIGMTLLEYYRIAQVKGFTPLVAIGVTGSTLYTLAIFSPFMWLPGLILFATIIATFGYYFQKGTSPFANIAITVFGLVYLTIPLTTLIQINYLAQGSLWLIYLLLVTKCTDAGAYFSGKAWGKHKLSPYISPGKTWEGAIVGTLIGVTASALFGTFQLNISLLEAALLGGLISIAGQFGDLAESLLKRDVGVKDSNSIPGLGGFLDILDSLIFTSPLLYLYLLERI